MSAHRENIRLLLVDDDALEARVMAANLRRPGRLDIEIANSGEAGLEALARQPFEAILADLAMPGMDGIELVRRVRSTDSSLPIILMTANATLERAVEGVRAGATDFLQKPVNVTAVQTLVERAVSERPIREEIRAIQERRAAVRAGNVLFGSHPRLDVVREFAMQVARTPASRVLITGESGTGKSLLARQIHDLSGLSGRFVEVNCAALPPHLLESELFGHEKGAFTDAKTLKRGLVESAEKGTILLDEIGAMSIDLQAKLLLFLESRQIRRVGGVNSIPVQTRVIAATNDDLRQRVRDRTFRQDLLYRLDVASVTMPPLREMPSVIPEIAERFTVELSAEFQRLAPEVTPDSFARLEDYPWPGNARELRNCVERALIFHNGGPFHVCPPVHQNEVRELRDGVLLSLGMSLDEVEKAYLGTVLDLSRGDLARIARQLGISRKTLWEKRKRYGL